MAVVGFLSLSLAKGQIVIDSSDIMSIGDWATTAIDTTVVGYSPGPAGSNQSWNFSLNLSPDLTDSIYATSVPPSYQSTFPSANILFVNKNKDSMFAEKTNTHLIYLGMSSSIPSLNLRVLFKFNDPLVGSLFPFTYGDSFKDTLLIDNRFPYTQQPGVDSMRVKVISYKDVVVDAYGSIATPSASFSNVLRVRTKSIEFDSVWVHVIFPQPSWQLVSTMQDTSYSFQWVAKQQKIEVLTLNLKSDSATVKSIEWKVNPVTSVSSPEFSYEGINPQGAQPTVYEISGKRINSNMPPSTIRVYIRNGKKFIEINR